MKHGAVGCFLCLFALRMGGQYWPGWLIGYDGASGFARLRFVVVFAGWASRDMGLLFQNPIGPRPPWSQ